MPSRSGQGGIRSDCKNWAKCGLHSLYYCRMYCDWWTKCQLLSNLSKKARKSKEATEKAGGE